MSPDAPPVVVVNETFARRFFGDNDPIGARVKQGWPEDTTPWREIVGVVNDVKINSLQGDPTLQAYLPVRQRGQNGGAFVARTDGDPRAARPRDRSRDSRDRSEPAGLQHPDDGRGDRDRHRQRAADDGVADRLCGAGAADGGDRRVRRHRLLGVAAHARARRPHGARREPVERAGAGAAPGNGRVPHRHRRRRDRRRVAGVAARVAALRRRRRATR